MDPRPAPSPDKLIDQFNDWVDDTEMPGRTMSYLKTGFLDELLATAESNESIDTIRTAWDGWESGKVGPAEVLQTMKDQGVVEFLTGLSAS